MNTESQICKDWMKYFPSLARFKGGRRLLRIQSPVVFGIELEKFSSRAYRPKFVALNLLSSFPEFAINRTIATSWRPQLSISYANHETDYGEAAEIMRKTFPLLSPNGDFSQEILIEIYQSQVRKMLEESASPLAVWFSLIQLLVFFERAGEAKMERSKLEAYVKTLDPASLAIFEDFDALMRRELDAGRDELELRKRSNISKGNWDVLPQ